MRDLVAAIEECLAPHNEHPKRYVWRAKGEQILRKAARANEAVAPVITGCFSDTALAR